MPIVNVTVTGKQPAEKKRDFMDFAADLINRETGTEKHLIYVFFNELDEENVRNRGPVTIIDWTAQPPRDARAKREVMIAINRKLADLTGDDVDQVVTLINDYPLESAAKGAFTRSESLD